MTVQEALAFGRKQLAASSSPALDARLLLQHVLEVNHAHLITHGEQTLSAAHEQQYGELLQRAGRHEPIPYLIGSAPFYGREFTVNSAVLIPRPETELLVEAALQWAAGRHSLRLADVGTGSGCLAVTLALCLPTARIEASDVSPAALEVARDNARVYNVGDSIHFHLGWLLDPISSGLDLIVANLPYIGDDEWTAVDHGVKWYEPGVALRGGPDGLRLIRQLLKQAQTRMAPSSAIFLEIGWQQGLTVRQMAQSNFPSAEIEIRPDYAGNDRIVSIIQ